MDSGIDFPNIEMDELIRKLGICVQHGPDYSPWSNGANEQNHGICDIIVKRAI